MCGPGSRIQAQQECKGLSGGSMDAARLLYLFRWHVFCRWLGQLCCTGAPAESRPREHDADLAPGAAPGKALPGAV